MIGWVLKGKHLNLIKKGGERVLKNQLYFALKKEMSFEKPMSNETWVKAYFLEIN